MEALGKLKLREPMLVNVEPVSSEESYINEAASRLREIWLSWGEQVHAKRKSVCQMAFHEEILSQPCTIEEHDVEVTMNLPSKPNYGKSAKVLPPLSSLENQRYTPQSRENVILELIELM